MPLGLVACAVLVVWVLRQDDGFAWFRRWPALALSSALTLALAVFTGLQVRTFVGEARLLHRLLERRFGSLPTWVEARLAKAVEEDLVLWGERVLDPTVSLEQLLAS